MRHKHPTKALYVGVPHSQPHCCSVARVRAVRRVLHRRAAATSSPRSKHQLRRSPLQHAALRRPRISLLSGCSLRARGSGTSGQGAGGCCSSRSGSFSSSVDRRPWGRRKRCCCHPRVPLGHYGRANSLTHQTVDGPAHPWPKPIISHLPDSFLVGAPCGVPGGHLRCSARGHKMTNAVRYASGTMSGPQGSSTCTLHWFFFSHLFMVSNAVFWSSPSSGIAQTAPDVEPVAAFLT